MSKTNVKIETDLIEKVKKIIKKKKPLRKINSYAEATREVFIDFVNKNRKLLSNNFQKNSENHIETATEEST
ncbi:hypothetical protein LCGC14_1887280 [marine sediment metagenome]|uniref:Uncharacterized protein n=1 Tax=marine sediment metagenome TaxID=412755 RepID=A0A0F9IYS1_9ZZZZ